MMLRSRVYTLPTHAHHIRLCVAVRKSRCSCQFDAAALAAAGLPSTQHTHTCVHKSTRVCTDPHIHTHRDIHTGISHHRQAQKWHFLSGLQSSYLPAYNSMLGALGSGLGLRFDK